MCFPPLLVGAALLGAGGVAKYFGDRKAEKAQMREQDRERARQAAMDQQQQAVFEDSLSKSGDVADPAAMAAAAARREDALHSAMLPPQAAASFLPGQSASPSIVQRQEARAVGRSGAEARALATALAALGGTGDQMQTLEIGLGRNNNRLAQLARDKAGSADAHALELEAAKQKGAFLRGLGGLAMQLGMSAATAGIGGGGAAAGAGAKAANTGSSLAKSLAKIGPY